MEKAKKTTLKRIIAAVCAVAVAALLSAMPLMADNESNGDGLQASILSGTARTGSIDTKLLGGGVLAEEDGVTVSVPAAVKLTKFLVSNGQMVSEGDAIAGVDRVTVMTAIAEVQKTLDNLAEKMAAEMEMDTDDTVTTPVGGKVKILYAEQGTSVRDVMLEHGALAVLSLDGLMAVNLTAEDAPAVGATVRVTLSDGTKTDGKVVSSLADNVTVTVVDDDYPVGDRVTIEGLGAGALYIYSPWSATAYTGTVSAVKVSEGKTVPAGSTLMTLSDVGDTAAYCQLMTQRQAYETLMLELFTMYQTQQLTAPCDGVVSGVDENSVQLLSNTQRVTLSLLANMPKGDGEKAYTNFAARVVSSADGVWNLLVDPNAVEVTDYKELSATSAVTEQMTQEASLKVDVPVYALEDGEWTQLEANAVQAGDLLIFAFDDASNAVWAVRIVAAEVPAPEETAPMPEEPTEEPTEEATEPKQPTEPELPTEPAQPAEPTVPSEPEQPTEDPTLPTKPDIQGEPTVPTEPGKPQDSTMPTQPGVSDIPSNPSGDYPSGGGNWTDMNGTGSMGNMSSTDGTIEQQPEDPLYAMDMAQIAAVIPQDTMTVEIAVDELDIRALKTGMRAEVKINALGSEKVSAAITSISNVGSNNGGSSKFTVELTMDRRENMLVGMNATANLVLNTTADALLVPVEALVEVGTRTLVYTGYDAENACLTGPVEVTTGVSDGMFVQILNGLRDGDTYYYAYYDTLEISDTPDFGGGMMFGR